jgi:hypothetical protein
MACKVKLFTMEFREWNISWPNFLFNWTTIRLPVKFRLELEEGSTKSDCYITQWKRGRVEESSKVESFATWVRDSGMNDWWNGSEWNGGNGSWSWFGNDVATFEDEPGFPKLKREAFPVYYGGIARAGFFEFRTVVYAAADGVNPVTEVASLYWGMLINVRSPDKGGFYLSGSQFDRFSPFTPPQ